MLVGIALRCSVECRACRIAIPLNGIVGSARCYHCGEVNAFDGSFWTRSLPRERFDDALTLAALERRRVSDDDGFLVQYGHQPISCRCNGGAIDPNALAAASAAGGHTCAACGAVVRVRVADPLSVVLFPTARYVVAETATDDSGHELEARAKPVVFQCMTCGGSLEVDGRKRLVSCEFCSSDNYLPDGLWQLLRPVPKPELFYVVCEVETLDERRVRAARPQLPLDEIRTLAADPDKYVRRAIARNPATPREVLETLARDQSRTVLEGLAENPSLPEALLELMARSDDVEFRVLAANNPRLPHDQLLSLEEDPVPRVAEIARARIEALRAQGVAIGGVKGFFAKLFG